MCSGIKKSFGGISSAPHTLAKIKMLARKLLQRIFTLQPSGRYQWSVDRPSVTRTTNEIAENEANERLQAAVVTSTADAMPPARVLCLETSAGCFFWQPNKTAADLDWPTVSCDSLYPAMQQFH